LLSASLVNLRFYLRQGVGAKLGGNLRKLLTVQVTAVYLVKTMRRIAGPSDDGRTFENIVY